MSRGNDLGRYSSKTLATQMRDYGFIQQSTPIDDGAGGESVSWVNTTVAPHSMAILPLSAHQVMEYKSINVEATHLIKIRGEISISPLNRILSSERVFEVLTVEDMQNRGVVKWVTVKERRG